MIAVFVWTAEHPGWTTAIAATTGVALLALGWWL